MHAPVNPWCALKIAFVIHFEYTVIKEWIISLIKQFDELSIAVLQFQRYKMNLWVQRVILIILERSLIKEARYRFHS